MGGQPLYRLKIAARVGRDTSDAHGSRFKRFHGKRSNHDTRVLGTYIKGKNGTSFGQNMMHFSPPKKR
jgi:hypothetical protein